MSSKLLLFENAPYMVNIFCIDARDERHCQKWVFVWHFFKEKNFKGWPDMQIILCTITVFQKKNRLWWCYYCTVFFYGRVWINWNHSFYEYDFHIFLEFLSTISFHFFYINWSVSKVLKTSRPANGNARQQFSEFPCPSFCEERKT